MGNDVATTSPLEVFIQRNFVAKFFREKLNFTGTNSDIAFLCHLFGGLRSNVHGSSMARWKARGRLPISANWTFFDSYYGWGTMSWYSSKFSLFERGWVTLNANFRGKGASLTNNFGIRKLESLGYRIVKNKLPKFSTGWVGRTNVTERQTDDRHTEWR